MTIYQKHNCADREAYLKLLSKSYQIDIESVRNIANILGPNEDFDGLISELENIAFNPYEDHLEDDFYDRCTG